MRVALGMVVGPGEGRMAREALACARRFVPGVQVFLLDDATRDGTFDFLQAEVAAHPGTVLMRNARPLGYRGIPASQIRLLGRVAEQRWDAVIRHDPDGLITHGSFMGHVRRSFERHGPGYLGSCRFDAKLRPRSGKVHRRALLLDLLPVGPRRSDAGWRLRVGWPSYVRFVPRALRRGWNFSDHVLGGVSVLHGETLEALRVAGLLSSRGRYRGGALWTDDVMLSIGALGVGYGLIDMHEPGQPAWSYQHVRAPLGIGAPEVRAREIAVVHPLKGEDGRMIREAFL